MRLATTIFLTIILAGFSLSPAGAQNAQQSSAQNLQAQIGIDEHLGERVPIGTYFFDADNNTVYLKDLIGDKPTIVAMVYYDCPYICSPLMDEVARVVSEMKRLRAGQDFNIVTISFDETEGPEKAAKFRDRYYSKLTDLNRPIDSGAWKFLVGTKDNIDKLTDAIGFRYVKQGEDFGHPGALTIVSPDGKITRYIKGSAFASAEVELALNDAMKGQVRSSRTVSNAPGGKVLSFCFQYDPEKGAWVPNMTRIAGTATLLLAGCFIGFVLLRGRAEAPKPTADADAEAEAQDEKDK